MAAAAPDHRGARLSLAAALLACACSSGPNPAYRGPVVLDAPLEQTPPRPADGASPEASPPPDGGSDPVTDVPPAEDQAAEAPPEVDGLAPLDAGDAAADDRPADAPLDALDAPVAMPCPADPDLALCLRFEGNAANESPSVLPIVARGLTYEAGPTGQAGRFVTATRLEVGPASALDASRGVTIEAWVNPRVLPTGSGRMGIVDYTREYALFLYPNGDVDCIVVTSDGTVTVRRNLLAAGIWTALACVADNQRVTLFRNGVDQGGADMDDLDPSGDTDTLVVGGNFSERNPDPFDGLLDNVRVWRRARTAAEMCAGAPGCRP